MCKAKSGITSGDYVGGKLLTLYPDDAVLKEGASGSVSPKMYKQKIHIRHLYRKCNRCDKYANTGMFAWKTKIKK